MVYLKLVLRPMRIKDKLLKLVLKAIKKEIRVKSRVTCRITGFKIQKSTQIITKSSAKLMIVRPIIGNGTPQIRLRNWNNRQRETKGKPRTAMHMPLKTCSYQHKTGERREECSDKGKGTCQTMSYLRKLL